MYKRYLENKIRNKNKENSNNIFVTIKKVLSMNRTSLKPQ